MAESDIYAYDLSSRIRRLQDRVTQPELSELSVFSELIYLLDRIVSCTKSRLHPMVFTSVDDTLQSIVRQVGDVMDATERSEYLREIDPTTGAMRLDTLIKRDELLRHLEEFYNMAQKCSPSASLMPRTWYKLKRCLDVALERFLETNMITSIEFFSDIEILRTYIEHGEECSRQEELEGDYRAAYRVGTHEDILAFLEEWVSDPGNSVSSSKQIVHLTGGAGSGKSTLVAEFSGRLRGNGQLGSYFCVGRDWCDFDNYIGIMVASLGELQATLTHSIATIARQGHFADRRFEPFKGYDTRSATPLEHFLIFLQTIEPTHPPFCFIIDFAQAINRNDYAAEDMLHILRIVHSCVTCCPALRIVITSCPGERNIAHVLGTANTVEGMPLLHHISLHTTSDGTWIDRRGDVCRLVRTELEKHGMAVLEGSPHDPDVIDRIAQEARGWLLYARELVAFLAEDGNAFHNRLELFASCEERCLAVYDTQELRPFVDTLWKDHLSEYLGDALSTSDEDATDLLNSLLSYIPDPPGPHHVTPRILSVLTGCSSTKVLDSLYPFRTIIVSDRFDVDSAFYFLHPIIRVFIADHSAIKSPRQPSVPWDTIQLRLTICCARVVLDTLESVPHDALSSTSSLQIYADTHPPPPVSDRGELRFAFNHLMDKPVNQALIDSMPGDEGRASLEAIMRIYGPVFEELYLWLCVVPGMAANS